MSKVITDFRQINTKNFSNVLRGFTSRDGTQREQLQAFIVFSIAHAQEHSNNFDFLNRVIDAARGMSMVPMGKVDKFIRYCVEGIAMTKAKGETERKYRKATKKTKVLYRFDNPANIPNWYEWNDGGAPQTPKYTEDKFRRAVMNAAKRWATDQGVNEQQINTALHEIEGQMGEHIIEWRSADTSGKDERKAA